MNVGRLIVEECDAFELPGGATLPAVGKSHEFAFVALDDFGHTQAILVWKFGLQEDLQLLRRHLPSLPFVCVVQDLVADDLELDLTGQGCLLIH